MRSAPRVFEFPFFFPTFNQTSFMMKISCPPPHYLPSLLRLVAAAAFLVMPFEHRIYGQESCGTIGGPNSIGQIPTGWNKPAGNDALYIKVYVNVIRRSDHTGGLSVGEVESAMNLLQSDFAPFNIQFVRDCGIRYIDNNNYYEQIHLYDCDLWNAYNKPDGINIYLGSSTFNGTVNNFEIFGRANGVPGNAFWVAGNDEFMDTPKALTRTNSHEMGHCLGLWHTHHGNSAGGVLCGINVGDPSQCLDALCALPCDECGDYCCDTPFDSNIQGFVNPNNCTLVGFNPSPSCPAPPLTNNIMSSTENQCRTSFTSDQGGRMRAMIANVPVLLASAAPTTYTSITILPNPAPNPPTVWNLANTGNKGRVFISGELVIESGATLRIEAGVLVHFYPNARLIIKPNGRLMLYGSLTSSSCRNTWIGVQVYGTANPSNPQSQFPVSGVRSQGRIELYSGSLIENAETAVQLWGPHYKNAGGQLTGTGATIRNSKTGIDYAPYQNFTLTTPAKPSPYIGSLTNCTFEANEHYPFSSNMAFYFIKMNDVNGLVYQGCDFVSTRNIESGGLLANWGYGIKAVDAGFSVHSGSTFTGLGYGVDISKTFKNRAVNIQSSYFEECAFGIRCAKMNNVVVVLNIFTLGTLQNVSMAIASEQKQTGVIFEEGATGFAFEGNNFYYSTSPGYHNFKTVGSVCKNVSANDNLVRLNFYNGIHFGNVSNGTNGIGLFQGLLYECNTNSDISEHDFDVPTGSIRYHQGRATSTANEFRSAGNRFSHQPPIGDFSDFNVLNFTQYHYRDVVFGGNVNEFPEDASPALSPNGFGVSADCSANYCDPPCPESGRSESQIKTDFQQNTVALNQLRASASNPPTTPQQYLLDYYTGLLQRDANTIVSLRLRDTLDFSTDSLLAWIANINTLVADVWLATEHWALGDEAGATQALNHALLRDGITQAEIDDIGDLADIFELLGDTCCQNLSEHTLEVLETHSGAEGMASGLARAILSQNGRVFTPTYIISEDLERTAEKLGTASADTRMVQVLPSPSDAFVQFKWAELPCSQGNLLTIHDFSGRLVGEQSGLPSTGDFHFPTGHLPSGVYAFRLLCDAKTAVSGKFVVLH